MNLQLKRISALVIVLALLALALPAQISAQSTGSSQVRFVHAVPGAPAVDIFVDSALAASKLSYGEATRFLLVTAGQHALKVIASDTAASLFQGSVNANPDMAQTVAIEGTDTAVETAVYEDELSPVKAGNIRFTAIHAIKDAPSVDVLQVDGQTVTPLIQGLTYGHPYGTVDIPASAADIVIVPSGADISSAVLKAEKVPMVAGTYNTIVALGTLKGSVKPSALLLSAATHAENAAASALVRLVQASPDSAAVDVYIGTTLVAPGLAYGAVTPHIALPAGAANVAVRVAKSAPDSSPLVTADLSLEAGKALTVVVAGPASALSLVSSPDNISALDKGKARLHLINATGAGKASASLLDGTVLASADPAGQEVAASVVDLFVNVDTPVISLNVKMSLSGGVLYDLIVAGDAKAGELIVGATGLSEQPGSVPSPAVVAVQPTPMATAEVQPTVAAQPTVAVEPTVAVQPTLVPTLAPPPPADNPTATPVSIPTSSPDLVAVAPTEVPAVEQPTEAPIRPTPFGKTGIAGKVDTDPGVNLKLREYPSTDARTLALVPTDTILEIDGVRGPATVEGKATPVATATLSAEGVVIDDVWVFATWAQPDGGAITGWTKAQYLVLTDPRGKRITKVADMLAFPQIPANRYGSIDSSSATPIPPDTNRIVGTVNVDVGVNLQLRRTPGIDGESLTLLPAGTELSVLEKTAVKSQGGLVGEPESTIWLWTRYDTDSGYINGWVNSQFIVLTQHNRPYDIKELPEAAEIHRGGVQGNVTVATPPPAPGIVATVDKVDPGTNLHLRRTPEAAAESLVLIPQGSQLPILGRNGNGLWLKVTYNGTEGWISSQYVTITRNGKAFKVVDLTNLTTEPDTAGVPTQATPKP
jgi:uncharacterized protein YgiM (DUF1202 family)